VHQYFTENPDNLYYSRYVPHPFLQFTGPRGPVPGTTADFYLGFKEIKLSDIPKPSGVIRVACLGGSTTADGYPESLQEFLARSAPGRKFQVLNFGSMWWSSVHSTVNYVLNVIDFKPDYLILHDSCNDHHYRGFPGLRGDCAHAYRLFQVPQTIGETLFRFSLIYRIGRTFLSWLIPSVFRRSMEMKEIGLLPGKTYNYVPAELYVIDRNIRTICTVARNEGSKVCLTTMPLSNVHTFGEEHDKVYRPHTRDVNEIIRKIARETGFPLADFDATMTGREEFFKDAVHATVAGNNAKAEAVGQVILADLKPS
jgi:lysophospholipase L1-like esterase